MIKKPGQDKERSPSPAAHETDVREGGSGAQEKAASAPSPEREFTPDAIAKMRKFIEDDRDKVDQFRGAPQVYNDLRELSMDAQDAAGRAWAERNAEKWRACRNQLLKAAEVSRGDERFEDFRERVAGLKESLLDDWELRQGDLYLTVLGAENHSDDTPVIGRLLGKRGRAVARLVNSPEVRAYEDAYREVLIPELREITAGFLERQRALVASLNEVDLSTAWNVEKIAELADADSRKTPPPDILEALRRLEHDVQKTLFGIRKPGHPDQEPGRDVFSRLDKPSEVETRLEQLLRVLKDLNARWPGKKRLSHEEQRAEVERLRRLIESHDEKAQDEQD